VDPVCRGCEQSGQIGNIRTNGGHSEARVTLKRSQSTRNEFGSTLDAATFPTCSAAPIASHELERAVNEMQIDRLTD